MPGFVVDGKRHTNGRNGVHGTDDEDFRRLSRMLDKKDEMLRKLREEIRLLRSNEGSYEALDKHLTDVHSAHKKEHLTWKVAEKTLQKELEAERKGNRISKRLLERNRIDIAVFKDRNEALRKENEVMKEQIDRPRPNWK